MAKASEITKGSFIDYKDQPHLVIEREFYSPGKGAAVIRFKLKNIKTGAVLKIVLKTDDTINEAEVRRRKVKFLYSHRNDFCFVDESNKRVMLPLKVIGDNKDFLKTGETYRIVFYQDQPIGLNAPIKMEMLVKEAPGGARGDTANSPTKEVVLETGLKIKAPMFIKEGDKILVNTEKREYVSRV